MWHKGVRLGGFLLAVLCVALPAMALDAPGNLITGVATNSSYAQYNHVYQWRVTGNNITRIGTVNLGVGGLLGYDCNVQDVANLSDGRVAVAHENQAGDGIQVSILTMEYDGGTGDLTGATKDLTVDSTAGWDGSRYGPRLGATKDGGFGMSRIERKPVHLYTPDGGGGFTESTHDPGGYPMDNCGTPADEAAIALNGNYRETRRIGFDGGAGPKLLASYEDTRFAPRGNSDGCISPLLQNGWVTANRNWSGSDEGSYVFDDMTMDGSMVPGVVGHILNPDGSTFDKAEHVASIGDGRVVMFASSGWDKWEDWYIFTMANNPTGQPAGSVGATGWDALLEFDYPNRSGPNAPFVGRIAGDYMYIPPPPPIPEPAGLSLLGLALLGLRRKRR